MSEKIDLEVGVPVQVAFKYDQASSARKNGPAPRIAMRARPSTAA
jgi:hypothetical protein